ncbi:MAG: flagellar protein [Roseburia sp.]|nr:flagellar protein [Roseburia sp.]
MNKISNQFASIEQVTDQYLSRNSAQAADSVNGLSFEEILKQRQEVSERSELRFSKHAQGRLNDRHINLSEEQSERLESGVMKASEKGIQESLVILDSLAFIVNVPNRTVVTAMDQSESKDNIFTNIDGAVIV